MGQKAIIRCWWESGLSSTSRNHLTTFGRPFVHYASSRFCFGIVHFIRNNCFLFCLLWLSSASAGRIGYITSFCSMIKLLHELKKRAVVNIEAFRHLIMFFLRTLCSLSILVQFSKIQSCKSGCTSDSPAHTFYAPLIVFNVGLAQLDFIVANCSDAVMSVFYSRVARSLIFLQLLTAVSWR